MTFKDGHLLGLEYVEKEDIELILNTALSFREVLERPIKKVPTLQGKTICNLFFESSTRTRLSFELAQKRLSADTINFAKSGSSTSKVDPLPGSLSTEIMPPMESTRPLTIGKPRPVPVIKRVFSFLTR